MQDIRRMLSWAAILEACTTLGWIPTKQYYCTVWYNFVIKLIMHFIIHQLLGFHELLEFPKIRCQVLPKMRIFSKTTTPCTEISFQLFYNLSIMLHLKFFQKSLQATLHFRLRKYTMPTFQTMRCVFPGCPWGLVHCFFGCRIPEQSTRKAGLEVCGGFRLGKETHFQGSCAWV